jgi:hypothetical protein
VEERAYESVAPEEERAYDDRGHPAGAITYAQGGRDPLI